MREMPDPITAAQQDAVENVQSKKIQNYPPRLPVGDPDARQQPEPEQPDRYGSGRKERYIDTPRPDP